MAWQNQFFYTVCNKMKHRTKAMGGGGAMTIQQTLAEMRHLMAERSRLQDDLSRAMDIATSTGSIAENTPKGKRISEKVAKYGTYCADLKVRMDTINQKLALYRQDVCHAINAVPVGSEKQALTLRYIELMTVRQIAKQMNYERQSMYCLIQKAEIRWLA